MNRTDDATSTPWWRVGTLWLVLGGPAAVVIAGTLTAVIAWRGSDPVLPHAETAGGAAIRAVPSPADPSAPAMQARNHAATPAR